MNIHEREIKNRFEQQKRIIENEKQMQIQLDSMIRTQNRITILSVSTIVCIIVAIIIRWLF